MGHQNTKLYAFNATLEVVIFFVTRILLKITFFVDMHTIETEAENTRYDLNKHLFMYK